MNFKVKDIVQFTGCEHIERYNHMKPFVGEVTDVDGDSVYVASIIVKEGKLRRHRLALSFIQSGEVPGYDEIGVVLFRLNRHTWSIRKDE